MVVLFNFHTLTSEFLYRCVVWNNMSRMHITHRSRKYFSSVFLIYPFQIEWNRVAALSASCFVDYLKVVTYLFQKVNIVIHSKCEWEVAMWHSIHLSRKNAWPFMRFFSCILYYRIATSFSISLFIITVWQIKDKIFKIKK